MEFCCDNLGNILDVKHQVFGREINDCIDIIEYFISCKIFIEIIEAVKYLHDQSPPIIQRDIKPGNILFNDQESNGIFFNLCDFGLAKFYDGKSFTQGIGTMKYMAPDSWGTNHNTSVDVYSLGMMGLEIFGTSR